MPEIYVALIAGASAIIGNLIITRSANRQNDAKRAEEKKKEAVEQAVKDTELKAILKSIDDRLQEHNGYAEKFAQTTERIEAIELAIARMQKDLEHLAKGA